MDIKSINNSFINGFIPNCLFYNTDYNISIDMNKIQYNNNY